jgi:hypothetical protein
MTQSAHHPVKSFVELLGAIKLDALQTFFVAADAANVEYLLSLNVNNRPMRPSHVEWLSSMIAQGEYHATAQGITVLRGGILGDGQHRLHAFRKVGFCPNFPLLVVTGADPRAGAAIDTGLKRTASDLMKFVFDRPEATGTTMAVCRFHGLYGATDKPISNPKAHKATPQQLLEWYEYLSPALTTLAEVSYMSRLPAPVTCALAEAIIAGEDSKKVTEFGRRIATGADCADGSPELALRRYLDKAYGSSGGAEVQNIRYAKTAAALEHFLQDKQMTRLIGKKALPKKKVTNTPLFDDVLRETVEAKTAEIAEEALAFSREAVPFLGIQNK